MKKTLKKRRKTQIPHNATVIWGKIRLILSKMGVSVAKWVSVCALPCFSSIVIISFSGPIMNIASHSHARAEKAEQLCHIWDFLTCLILLRQIHKGLPCVWVTCPFCLCASKSEMTEVTGGAFILLYTDGGKQMMKMVCIIRHDVGTLCFYEL